MMAVILVFENWNTGVSGVTVRPSIAEFAIRMEKVMSSHDAEHPDGRRDNIDMLYEHFLEEVDEVNMAFKDIRPGLNPPSKFQAVIEECVDVANMSMLLAAKAAEMNLTMNPTRRNPNESNPGT